MPDARATVAAAAARVVVDGLRRLPGLFFSRCWFFFFFFGRHLMRRREANQELAQGQLRRVPVRVGVRVLVNK